MSRPFSIFVLAMRFACGSYYTYRLSS